jgi:hypothetical protein
MGGGETDTSSLCTPRLSGMEDCDVLLLSPPLPSQDKQRALVTGSNIAETAGG